MTIEISKHKADIILLALENYEDMAKELTNDDEFCNDIRSIAVELAKKTETEDKAE